LLKVERNLQENFAKVPYFIAFSLERVILCAIMMFMAPLLLFILAVLALKNLSAML